MNNIINYINKQFHQGNKLPLGLKGTSISETIETEAITIKTVKPFIDKKVMIEINETPYFGKLTTYKQDFAVIQQDNTFKPFKLQEITKIIGMNGKKIILNEVVRKESDGYHVRSEKGKNLGGPYKSKGQAEKRLKQVEYFKHMKEDPDLLLQDRLKQRFFGISEEVVNKDHKGRMSKDMQGKRDKIASKLKNVKVVKGPPGRDDTPEEAKYRLATYIAWKKHHGKD